jgi:uncharacterized protein (DUF1330 family)
LAVKLFSSFAAFAALAVKLFGKLSAHHSSTEETTMAKGYWINMFRSIKDPAKVDAYRKLAGPVMEASGAKFLVRGDPTKVYEHGVMQRVVVIEFESVAKAMAVHDSPGYQAALKALGDGAVRDLRIVEGI